ncbi:helix-turn-helix domain-containing protein [Roseiarcus sp.]|uniref:AraC family transcriptional regulator n=1 Tax=Roseiarcus sp. TaxID=1969460 RepID=UPI003F992995
MSSKVFDFADPAEYQASIRAADVTVVPTARGHFRAELTRVDFHWLWMQRFAESAPVVKFTAMHRQRSVIVFLTDPNQPGIHHGGMDVSSDDIVVYGSAASVHHRTTAPCRFGAMSLTPDDLAAKSYALVGRERSAPIDTCRVRPDPSVLAHLRRLHAAAGRMAATAPDVLTHPETARSLEEALTQAMIWCLTDGERLEPDRRFRTRAAVMARLEDLLEMNPTRPLYLSEICAAAGASERTLRACCQEHLGMGPQRYLWLRRMHLARRALLRACEGDATVTSIAVAHGFWELGRFSVSYRALFGETPLATLRRWADDTPPPASPAIAPIYA